MGQRWLVSLRVVSSTVIGCGVAPDAETRCTTSPIFPLGVKRMTPSLFQLPPRPDGASHRVCIGPPAISSLFSFPSAKNARDRPSGDQNGKLAPSVLARLFGSREPISYNRRALLPPDSRSPTTASVCPFGAIAMSRTGKDNGAEKYIVFSTGRELRHQTAPAINEA